MGEGAEVEDLEWVPIGLTCIIYPKGDMLGRLLAYSCLCPFFILSAFTTLIFFRRDLHTIFYFVGILLNEAINLALKNTIQDPRPDRQGDRSTFDHYGMPSSHAQFMWFFSAYLCLFVAFRIHGLATNLRRDVAARVLVSLAAFTVAALVCYSRIYLSYHSWQQVLCGGILGSAVAALWFLMVQFVFTPLFPWLVRSRVAGWLLLRDLSLIPNVMWFEYVQSRTEAKQVPTTSWSKTGRGSRGDALSSGATAVTGT